MKNCLLISTCFRWNASLLITPPDQITRFFNEKSICCFSFAVSSRCTVTSLQGTSCVCWNLCSYLSREKKKFRNWTSQCNRWKMKATHVLWLAHFLFKNSIFFSTKVERLPPNTCRLISPFSHFPVKITRTFQWAAWTWRHCEEKGELHLKNVEGCLHLALHSWPQETCLMTAITNFFFLQRLFAPFRAAILHPAASWHLLAITNEFYSAGFTPAFPLIFFSYCFLRPPIKSGDFFKIGFWAENENFKSIAKLNFVFFSNPNPMRLCDEKISDPAEQQRPMHKWVPLKSNRCIAVIVRLAHSTPLGSLPKEK